MKGRNFRIMLEQAGKSCEWLGGAEVLCKQFEANEKTVETVWRVWKIPEGIAKKCLDWKQVEERAKDSYELEMTAIKYTSFQNDGKCKEGRQAAGKTAESPSRHMVASKRCISMQIESYNERKKISDNAGTGRKKLRVTWRSRSALQTIWNELKNRRKDWRV
jgi:hypothetical protein